MAVETVQQITRPPEFIEAEAKLYLDQLRPAIAGQKAGDLSQIYGPQYVAGLGQLTQDAISAAGGLGAYAPYLQAAQAATGPTAYQAIICLHINKMLLDLHYKNMIFKHKKVYQH
jgi:hypothetical protein